MKRLTSIAALTSASIAALTLAAPVLGDRETFMDPKGDSSRGPNMDFKRASHGHEDGRLRHTAVVWGSARASRRETLMLQISTRAGNGAEYVCARVRGRGDRCFRFRFNPSRWRKAWIRKVADDKIEFLFREGAIGRPDRYRWRILYSEFFLKGMIDRVPDGQWGVHILR